MITCVGGSQYPEVWRPVGGCLQPFLHLSVLEARLSLQDLRELEGLCLSEEEAVESSLLVRSCSTGQSNSEVQPSHKDLTERCTRGTLIAFSSIYPFHHLLNFVCFSFVVFLTSFVWVYGLCSVVRKTNDPTTNLKQYTISFSQVVSKAINENIWG